MYIKESKINAEITIFVSRVDVSILVWISHLSKCSILLSDNFCIFIALDASIFDTHIYRYRIDAVITTIRYIVDSYDNDNNYDERSVVKRNSISN